MTLNIIQHELKNIEVVRKYNSIESIKCNSSQINQVFTNLLVNAVHSIEDKGKIIIETTEDKNNIYINIADNGKGISQKEINKIFKKGFTTKKEGQGTGLGLAIVKHIIKLHNGKISVSSNLGQGTEFKISLPKK